jgi:hypothetical protein
VTGLCIVAYRHPDVYRAIFAKPIWVVWWATVAFFIGMKAGLQLLTDSLVSGSPPIDRALILQTIANHFPSPLAVILGLVIAGGLNLLLSQIGYIVLKDAEKKRDHLRRE